MKAGSRGWAGIALCLLACSRTGLPEPQDDAGTEPLCVELPNDGQGATVVLSTDARLRRVDVFFLIDTSGSMAEEIDAIRDRLRDEVAPAIAETFPDVEYGVGSFTDFPVPAFGYGAPTDRPFTLVAGMTGDLGAVQAALNRLTLDHGADPPESQVEALYQLATGEGLGRYVSPSLGCGAGGFGAPCFRDGAHPVAVLLTDAPFHDGPSDRLEARYFSGSLDPPPHSYEETLGVLQDRRISVIGLWSGEPGGAQRLDLVLTAQDTGAVDDQGRPLVFDVGQEGQGLASSLVQSLGDFAAAAIFDVGVRAEDPDLGDGVDPTLFVAEVRPRSAVPMSGIAGIDQDGARFLGVVAGTELTFDVILRADAVVPGERPKRFGLRLVFVGDGLFDLDERLVHLVVPALDGTGCGG